MRLPTETEIADINARHLIETPLRPADLLFVFGTRQDVQVRVDKACRLWRAGYFRWAIVSGGVTRDLIFRNARSSRTRWPQAASRRRSSSERIAR